MNNFTVKPGLGNGRVEAVDTPKKQGRDFAGVLERTAEDADGPKNHSGGLHVPDGFSHGGPSTVSRVEAGSRPPKYGQSPSDVSGAQRAVGAQAGHVIEAHQTGMLAQGQPPRAAGVHGTIDFFALSAAIRATA